MKKILLTLMVGFCVGGMATAQEPSKVAKKKSAVAPKAMVAGNDAAKVQAKEARAKAFESGKATPAATSTRFSKDPAQKAN